MPRIDRLLKGGRLGSPQRSKSSPLHTEQLTGVPPRKPLSLYFCHSRLGAALHRPRTGSRWEVDRAHPRSNRRITAAHCAVVCSDCRPGPGGRRNFLPLASARTWRGGSWRRTHLARRDRGRARVEGARLRQDLGAASAHFAQNELALEDFKKNFPAELAKIRARLPKGVEIELWWQDEARIGQKNKLTRRLGQTWHAPAGAPRPAHRMGL